MSILSNFAIRSANIIKYSLMENNGTQFLTDILTRIHSMKEELEQLEGAVLEQLDKASEPEPQEDAPAAEEVEMPSGVEEAAPAVEEVEETPAEEIPVEETKLEETPEETLQIEGSEEESAEETVFDFAEEEDMPDFEEETVSEVPAAAEEQPTVEQAAIEPVTPEQQIVEQPIIEQPVEEIHSQIQEETPASITHSPEHVGGLVIDDELEVLPIGEALAPAKDAVMDKMAAKESWRTDMPGAKVSDVRSAISLNDRVLFINTLFHEDPIAFQNALSQLNSMPSFDEGARFILDKHPEWNTESDVVYRFMMAVRRKLR